MSAILYPAKHNTTMTIAIIIDFLQFLFFIISPHFDYAYVPEYDATNSDFTPASPLKGIIATVVNIIANDKIIDNSFFIFIIISYKYTYDLIHKSKEHLYQNSLKQII